MISAESKNDKRANSNKKYYLLRDWWNNLNHIHVFQVLIFISVAAYSLLWVWQSIDMVVEGFGLTKQMMQLNGYPEPYAIGIYWFNWQLGGLWLVFTDSLGLLGPRLGQVLVLGMTAALALPMLSSVFKPRDVFWALIFTAIASSYLGFLSLGYEKLPPFIMIAGLAAGYKSSFNNYKSNKTAIFMGFASGFLLGLAGMSRSPLFGGVLVLPAFMIIGFLDKRKIDTRLISIFAAGIIGTVCSVLLCWLFIYRQGNWDIYVQSLDFAFVNNPDNWSHDYNRIFDLLWYSITKCLDTTYRVILGFLGFILVIYYKRLKLQRFLELLSVIVVYFALGATPTWLLILALAFVEVIKLPQSKILESKIQVFVSAFIFSLSIWSTYYLFSIKKAVVVSGFLVLSAVLNKIKLNNIDKEWSVVIVFYVFCSMLLYRDLGVAHAILFVCFIMMLHAYLWRSIKYEVALLAANLLVFAMIGGIKIYNVIPGIIILGGFYLSIYYSYMMYIKKSTPMMSCLLIASWALVIGGFIGSEAGIRKMVNGSWLMLPFIFLCLPDIISKTSNKLLFPIRNQITAICMAVLCVLGAMGSLQSYKATYNDCADRTLLLTEIDHPRLRGIFTAEYRAESLSKLFGELDKYINPGDEIIAEYGIPMVYFVTKTAYPLGERPIGLSSESAKKYLHKVEKKGVMPKAIVLALINPSDENWGCKRGYDAAWKTDPPISHETRLWAEKHGYTLKWHNKDFEIYLRPY